MTAKERLVEIIKYYKEARTDEGLADAILKEFIQGGIFSYEKKEVWKNSYHSKKQHDW